MIGALIVACEIGFWLLVAAGLYCRYLRHWRKTGALLLILTPVVDLVLLAATVFDLRAGAEPSMAHGLAAVYVGVSIAFGHRMIQWADERFAWRFRSGPPPRKLYGREHAAHERRGWYLHVLAWCIGSLLLLGLHVLAGLGEIRIDSPLLSWSVRWAIVVVIDFVISFSYTLWPRREKQVSS